MQTRILTLVISWDEDESKIFVFEIDCDHVSFLPVRMLVFEGVDAALAISDPSITNREKNICFDCVKYLRKKQMSKQKNKFILTMFVKNSPIAD